MHDSANPSPAAARLTDRWPIRVTWFFPCRYSCTPPACVAASCPPWSPFLPLRCCLHRHRPSPCDFTISCRRRLPFRPRPSRRGPRRSKPSPGAASRSRVRRPRPDGPVRQVMVRGRAGVSDLDRLVILKNHQHTDCLPQILSTRPRPAAGHSDGQWAPRRQPRGNET